MGTRHGDGGPEFDRARVYADLFEQIGDAIIVTALDGTIVDWNGGAERMFGWRRDEAVGRRPDLFLAGEGKALVDGILGELAGRGGWYQEYVFNRRDGSRGVGEAFIVPVSDAGGDPYLTVGVNRDVTRRKAMEQEWKFAADVLDQLTEAVHVVRTRDGTFVHVNARFQEMFGYAPAEVVGEHVSLINGGDAAAAAAKAVEIIAVLERERYWTGELINRRKDGTEFWCRARVNFYDHPEHGEVWVSSHEDITAIKEAEARRRALEEQLERAQRLEALGTLASGVAHDFNNILQGLTLTLEALQDALPSHVMVQRDIRRGLEYAERGQGVVDRILDFARNQQPSVAPIDLGALVTRTAELLRPLMTTSIELDVELPEQRLACLGDERQLEQVLVNLCSNARHAMRQSGGTLAISVAPRGERWIALSVSDTGPGIPADIQSRIFDPFFSTKTKGEGTGLGLSIVHNIVKSHGGSIKVISAPGKGTRFAMRLPRADLVEERPASQSPPPPMALRVLIVDDEASLLQTYQRVLERRAMTVSAFADPRAALAAFERDPAAFDVVVTDQTMPGMTGTQLARRVGALRTDAPVVLISGQSALAELEEEEGVIRAYLAKPFRVAALVEIVQRVAVATQR